jgi:hypothetical protein
MLRKRWPGFNGDDADADVQPMRSAAEHNAAEGTHVAVVWCEKAAERSESLRNRYAGAPAAA